ncbi:MAG: superfamily II RNA helicase [Myxococcota bacterium]|jgi:superfamily II RNA helicase
MYEPRTPLRAGFRTEGSCFSQLTPRAKSNGHGPVLAPNDSPTARARYVGCISGSPLCSHTIGAAVNYQGLTLDRFQVQAIEHLQNDRSVLVCAPTGTGKTIIADWIVEQALNSGKQVIYTAPVKALSNQKFRDWVRIHGDSVGLVTGDLVIRRDAPCLVMTTEVLRNMLLTEGCPKNLLAVVLDEIHFLDDRERGTVWEEVLIYLPPEVQVVGLSATLSNVDDFAEWLESVRQRPVGVVIERNRAVPLNIVYASVDTGMCDPKQYAHRFKRKAGQYTSKDDRGGRSGRDRKGGNNRNGSRGRRSRVVKTRHHHIHRMMSKEDLFPYLYFVWSRRDTERFARQLFQNLDRRLVTREQSDAIADRIRKIAADVGPALDPDLRAMYCAGIAFHHAGLHVHLKTLVEELYEARLIQVLYCTSTFALGINMPARAVAFDAIEAYDGTRVSPLTVRAFMQAAGRAGRRGIDAAGTVVVRVELDSYDWMRPLLEKYAREEAEPVTSSFNLSWNSVVNLLHRNEETQIRGLVEKSFLSWHLERKNKADKERLTLLEERGRRSSDEHKEYRRLKKKHERSGDQVWDLFQSKVAYLQSVGYVSQDSEFNAGARILQHVQISEILMTELVLSGLLDDLDPETLFGAMCVITNDLGRHAEWGPRLTREDRRVLHALREHVEGPIVAGANEFTGEDSTFGADLLPIGKAWAKGVLLPDILMDIRCDTDLSGSLITGFRRAKDLVSQLATVYRDLPDRHDALRDLVRKVSRDEVEVVG